MRNRLKKSQLKSTISALGLMGLIALAPSVSYAKDVVIHAGRLIDGVSKQAQTQKSIVIKDDKIVSIENGYVTVSGAEVIDLSNATVLPGLIDTHVHLSGEAGNENALLVKVGRSDSDAAINGTIYAKRTLDAGFTTVRDVGGGQPSISVRNAINAGKIPGPRIWAARTGLSITGGHGDAQNGLAPSISGPDEWAEGIVNGNESARRAVRHQHKYGADLIKIAATGGVMSVNESGDAQHFSEDEIKAIVETAHLLGLKVAAHAHGKLGMEAAIRAGVDSIEHGSLLDDDTIVLFKKHGTYLVPTLLTGKTVQDLAKSKPELFDPRVREKMLKIGPVLLNSMGKAYRGGVKIAFGTDAGVAKHGDNAQEFALLVSTGIPPMEAILSATRNAADLLGASDKVGSIQSGRYADIIAVAGDPLQDITELERVQFIMKGGEVHKAL